jgi:hypothetical protein
MALDYAWEKFNDAVRHLAAAPGSRNKRLGEAYLTSLIHVRPEDLPADIRDEFLKLKADLTRNPEKVSTGVVESTLYHTSPKKVAEMIISVVKMYDCVARNYDR